MPASVYLRAVAIGLASGARSQVGTTALAWTAPPPHALTTSGPRGHRAVTQALSKKWAKLSTGLALAGELVGDKAPTAPPRTAPPALAARLVLGGLSGFALAEREGAKRSVAAVLAVAGSAATTFLGPKYRAAIAAKAPAIGPLSSDLPGAVAEDAFAVGLAWAAAR